MVLAMHMANELLTPAVAGGLFVVAGLCVALASRAARREEDPGIVPLMGVMGAFVFAAQMINFSLPLLPGTSGHLGGGLLLAILLGPHAATLVMTSILITQCLIFQDGGLLALGANILNMGVLPCYLGYGVFRAIIGRSPVSSVRFYVATFVAGLVAVNIGAVMVPLQAGIAGVVNVPVRLFVGTMLGVHLVIGAIEGLITFVVVGWLHQVRPDAIRNLNFASQHPPRLTRHAVVGSMAVVALLIGGLVSHLASDKPDGLEWSYAERPDQPQFKPMVDEPAEAGVMARTDHWLANVAPLADYGGDSAGMLTVAGISGTAVTLGLVLLIGRIIGRRQPQTAATDAP